MIRSLADLTKSFWIMGEKINKSALFIVCLVEKNHQLNSKSEKHKCLVFDENWRTLVDTANADCHWFILNSQIQKNGLRTLQLNLSSNSRQGHILLHPLHNFVMTGSPPSISTFLRFLQILGHIDFLLDFYL